MRFDYFFKLAKEYGIEDVELFVSSKETLSFQLFHGKIDEFSNNKSLNVVARGIVNGKFGSASSDVYNKEKALYLVKQIKQNASIIENDDPAIIFSGSKRYQHINTYNKELKDMPVEEKIKVLSGLDGAIRNADNRIIEVAEVGYSEQDEEINIINSKGLKLKQRNNFFYSFAQAVAKENEQVKSGFKIFFNNDFNQFNVEEFAKEIAKETTSKLGGEPCKSKKYKAVLDKDVVASLLRPYISNASSEQIQKGSSLFIGKLNTKIASSKITITDEPLRKNVFVRTFDDEGVATSNKPIIKNGMLMNYLYNLKTAAKENRESTGNGYRDGASIDVEASFLYLKPGKKSLEELFQTIGNGVYITDVTGLHAGLNSQSGNFSLQSAGFEIIDGKIGKALDGITISGNLMELFNDVKEVGSDSKINHMASQTSSVIVKSLSVSGK